MNFPDFYAAVPGITLHDPLAELLGAPADGLLRYTFADAVKLAGHACPTVAGAWRMSTSALHALYPDELPQRGGVRIEFPTPLAAGVCGVVASIATLLTGAAGEGGFKGLGGQHVRRHLLQFGIEGCADARYTRLDNGRRVTCHLDLSHIPPAPETATLLAALLREPGNRELGQHFARLWQERVRRILLEGEACLRLSAPLDGE